MTRDQIIFLNIKEEYGGTIILGNNASTRIDKKAQSISKMEKLNLRMSCMLKVENKISKVTLKCVTKGYDLTFHSKGREIESKKQGNQYQRKNRTSSNMYILDGVKGEKCCIGKMDESWLWHIRMGHISIANPIKLRISQVIIYIPK